MSQVKARSFQVVHEYPSVECLRWQKTRLLELLLSVVWLLSKLVLVLETRRRFCPSGEYMHV